MIDPMTHMIPLNCNHLLSPIRFACSPKLQMIAPLLALSLLTWMSRSCTPLVPYPTYAIPAVWDGKGHGNRSTRIPPSGGRWSALTGYLQANGDSATRRESAPSSSCNIPDSEPITRHTGSHTKKQSVNSHRVTGGRLPPVKAGEPALQTVKAIVPQTQTLTSGARVKLELSEDMYVKGFRIPRGTVLYGACRFAADRMMIPIRSLVSGGQIIRVELSVYDLDGLEGIHIPQSPVRRSVKSSVARAVESIGIRTGASSSGSRAAIAGIYAARNLLGDDIRKKQVALRAGYHLLLKDRTRK